MATGQILVVDDEADIRELLGITLIRMGLEPHCAGSVAEAMELLGNKTFELCLTDMRLGDGDGLSIVEHITKSHPSLRSSPRTAAPRTPLRLSRPAHLIISANPFRWINCARWCVLR